MPDPVEAGDDFITCWGFGKPFGDGDTPDQIILSVSGVNKGPGWLPSDPDPINGVFTLLQIFGSPGLFRFIGGDVVAFVLWTVSQSVCVVSDLAFVNTFSGGEAIPCLVDFENALTDKFVGGTAVVTIPEIE